MEKEQLEKALAAQAVEITELREKEERLQDIVNGHDQWLRDAKRDAGYDRHISFDVVWKETLEKANGKN